MTVDTVRLPRRHCGERGGEVQRKGFEKTSISLVARGRYGRKRGYEMKTCTEVTKEKACFSRVTGWPKTEGAHPSTTL